MIKIGNFFFRTRNVLFIVLYLLLFIPSPAIFTQDRFGEHYWYWPVALGLLITIAGQVIRGITIGLAYIIRGGKNRQIYADKLVTEGIFNHCRNPLYLGNILMLLGVGVISNSLIYVGIVIPVFIFIYQAIVLAEENFLHKKFSNSFELYCKNVNRWLPSLTGIGKTMASMKFNWKRWLVKEYNTLYIWLSGITLTLLLAYPKLTNYNKELKIYSLIGILFVLLLAYLFIRFLKKSGRLHD